MTTNTDPALTAFAAWQEADARFRTYTGPEDCEAYREIVEAENRTLRATLDARATTPTGLVAQLRVLAALVPKGSGPQADPGLPHRAVAAMIDAAEAMPAA